MPTIRKMYQREDILHPAQHLAGEIPYYPIPVSLLGAQIGFSQQGQRPTIKSGLAEISSAISFDTTQALLQGYKDISSQRETSFRTNPLCTFDPHRTSLGRQKAYDTRKLFYCKLKYARLVRHLCPSLLNPSDLNPPCVPSGN